MDIITMLWATLIVLSCALGYMLARQRALERQIARQAMLLIGEMCKPRMDKNTVADIRRMESPNSNIGIHVVNYRRSNNNYATVADGYLVVNANAWVMFEEKHRRQYVASVLGLDAKEITSINSVCSDRTGGCLL